MANDHDTELLDEVSGANLMAHLTEFGRWQKIAGSKDERESLLYIRKQLDALGCVTSIIDHDAYISIPGKSRIEVDGTEIRSITHSHGRSSPADGLSGELVDIGEGELSVFDGCSLAGKIVLADGIAASELALRLSRAGAAAVVFVSPHEHLHEMCISTIWGSPSNLTLSDLPDIVACTISERDGMGLREQLARGEKPEILIWAEVDTSWRKTPILVADLPAPHAAADDPFILFSGHHDTWHFGVMDNGSANAVMIEVARICAAERSQMTRSLRLCFWSGHSQGRFSSSAWYAEEYWDELDRRCAVHINLDSLGGRGASSIERASAMAELAPLAEEAIRTGAGRGYEGRRKARSQDESFSGIGIPAMFGVFSEQPPGTMRIKTASLGWWWHTPDDLIDKIDEDTLVRDARVYAHAVWSLVSAPVLPLRYEGYAAGFGAELLRIRGSLAGRLDINGLLEANEVLGQLASRISEAAHSAKDLQARRLDAALIKASRNLVAISYTRGDRFGQDPALPLPAWPTLDPIRAVASAPDDNAAKFFAVEGRRARNRIAFALHEAISALRDGLA